MAPHIECWLCIGVALNITSIGISVDASSRNFFNVVLDGFPKPISHPKASANLIAMGKPVVATIIGGASDDEAALDEVVLSCARGALGDNEN